MRFLEGKLKTKTLIFYIPFSHLFLNFLKIIQKGTVCSFLARHQLEGAQLWGGLEGVRVAGSREDSPVNMDGEWGTTGHGGRHELQAAENQKPQGHRNFVTFSLTIPLSPSPLHLPTTPHLCLAKHTSLLIDRQGNLFGWGVGSGPALCCQQRASFSLVTPLLCNHPANLASGTTVFLRKTPHSSNTASLNLPKEECMDADQTLWEPQFMF